MSLMQKLILFREFTQLRKNFQQYFAVTPALSPELRRAAHQVRHQVYCKELGWEPPQESGLEIDAFDEHQSIHCLMYAHREQDFVGCIRLVRTARDKPEQALPLEQFCGEKLDQLKIKSRQPNRLAIAEVSRLAVTGKYRRRKNEQNQPVTIKDSDYGSLKTPRFPYIPMGLYFGMFAMAEREGVDTLLLLTEPSLAINFVRLGARMEPAGEPIDHHGLRFPYLLSVRDTLDKLNFMIKPLYKAIATQINEGYDAQQAGPLAEVLAKRA